MVAGGEKEASGATDEATLERSTQRSRRRQRNEKRNQWRGKRGSPQKAVKRREKGMSKKPVAKQTVQTVRALSSVDIQPQKKRDKKTESTKNHGINRML